MPTGQAADWLLPENLFYNTTAPGIVMVFNRKKRHLGEILLINASKLFTKGRSKTFSKISTSTGLPRSITTGRPRKGFRPS